MHVLPELKVTLGQYSMAGLKPSNQDFHGAIVPDGRQKRIKGITLAVADGISSSDVSAEASETAIKSLLTDYYCTSDAWTVKTAASRVIATTNSWLHSYNRNAYLSDFNRGRVCTLSALILKHRQAHLLHVGDSRIWRLSGESLEQLTRDHRISLSSAESYLSCAMGIAEHVDIDYQKLDLQVGDIFLLTTDGVHEFVDQSFVVEMILQSKDLNQAAKLICDEALRCGSDDNLTIQIVKIEALPAMDGLDVAQDAAKLPRLATLKEGQHLDEYEIIRQIHTNARSHIYMAVAPGGTKVALKIPSTELSEDEGALKQFFMEEWIANRISNPHVLSAARAPERRSYLYSVSEWIDGQTLRQWMRDNPRPSLSQVRDIAGQIIKGLRAFHRLEMLHQDLRPENIMIDGNGTARIIDFGSTRVAGVAETQSSPDPILGTLQYTAPEYFSGEPVGPHSDLFSLGVILYEMLSGDLPYGIKVSSIRHPADVKKLRYKTAIRNNNGVSEWIDDALHRAVHPRFEQRYPALSEFFSDLCAPNPNWKQKNKRPLVERDPVRFWKSTTLIFALICLYLTLLLTAN